MTPETCCAICGEPRILDEGWFLLAENRWTDRLRVLAYNPALAKQEGIFCACSRAHVRELVVHWMTTGRLDHPFARTPGRKQPRWRGISAAPAGPAEPDIQGSSIVGELAVHRESLVRILRDDPQSLSAVLEALVAALMPQVSEPGSPPQAPELESEELALTEA